METLKTSPTVQQVKKLFLHQYYNFEIFYLNPLSPTSPAIAQLFNALVKGLNVSPYLPELVVMIIDKDIIESINRFDYSIHNIIESNIHWLIKQIARAILGHRESLKKIRPGAAPIDLPQIVWIPILA